MADAKIRDFLKNHHVKYASILHSPAFTSQEIAAAAHISGKQLAKIVIVKIDGKLAMMVLPANDQVNMAKLKSAIGAKGVDLAVESEFKDKFPGCEVGAMPPFGELYGLPVYISSRLTLQDHILFNAGSHSELMEMSWHDFQELVHPEVVAA